MRPMKGHVIESLGLEADFRGSFIRCAGRTGFARTTDRAPELAALYHRILGIRYEAAKGIGALARKVVDVPTIVIQELRKIVPGLYVAIPVCKAVSQSAFT